MLTESFRNTFDIEWNKRKWNAKELEQIADREKSYQPIEMQNI